MTARDPCMDAQRELCAEFATWCEAQGVPFVPGVDDPFVLTLMSRDQRRWLASFIARWDFALEHDARQPASLRTPLELAGEFVAVAREHSGREEFAQVLAGERAFASYLDVDSAIDLAFARLHRVPVGGNKTFDQAIAENRVKASALQLVLSRLVSPAGA